MGTPENPVWLGEYVWEETSFDGSEPKTGPLPDEVLGMFRPQHCLLCNIKTANMHVAYAHYESKGHFKKVAHYMKFNYNAIGTLKSKEGKFEPVTCDVCSIELLTRMVYLQHYEGKQHAKNLKKKALNTPINLFPVEKPAPVPVEPAVDVNETEELLKGLPPPPPLPKLGDYVCALCDVTTATRAQMEMHNNGARHLKNVAKLGEGELREFYMRNGNCEPAEIGSADPSSTATASTTPASSQAAPYPQTPGYMPMNQPMMPQYPQMPYGSYPYPMPYDYNSWCQMYGQQYAAYYSQYGQYPYGPYGQQYPGQPPYNPGQQGQQPYNSGQQGQPPYNPGQQDKSSYNPGQQGQPPFNPGQQDQSPYNPGQQGQTPYNAGQQGQPPYNPGQQDQSPYNPGQQGQPPSNPKQQYTGNTVTPGNSYPENHDPNAWHGNTAHYYGNAENPPTEGDKKVDSQPTLLTEANSEENDAPEHSANDGIIDSTIFRKYSTHRLTVRTPPKASEVRVSSLPEGFDKKPLAVLPSVPQNNEKKREEREQNLCVSNGVDAEGFSEKEQSTEIFRVVESTLHPSGTACSPAHETECDRKLSADVQSSSEAATSLEPVSTLSPTESSVPDYPASNEEKGDHSKTVEDYVGTLSETQVICLDSDAANPEEQTWRSNSPTIPLLGEIPAGIQISDELVSDYDDLPSIGTQDPFPFNQINSNEPPPPGCSVETKLPAKLEEPVPEVSNEAKSQNNPTVTESAPSSAPSSVYYPAPTGVPPESVAPYYSAPVHNAAPYYSAPPNGGPAYNYTPTVSAPPSTYNYPSSHYSVHQPPNYSSPVPFMPPTPEYSVPPTCMAISMNYSGHVPSVPAVSKYSSPATSSPAVSVYSAPPTTSPQKQIYSAAQNVVRTAATTAAVSTPSKTYSAPVSVPVPAPPSEPPNETVPEPPPDVSAQPPQPEADISQEATAPDKTVPAKPKLSSFFARAAVKMIKEKKNQQEVSQSGPSSQGDDLKKTEDAVLPIKGKTISIPTIKGTSLESGSTTEDIVASGFGVEKEAVLPSPAPKSDSESASRNKSLERKKKKSHRKSHSRSRSSSRSSRTPRRHRRRRSSSRSLSPDRSPRRYDDNRRWGYRGGYGYGRRGRGFYRYRGNFRNRNDWDRDDLYRRYDRYERKDCDEFGRERSWKRDERDKRRRSSRRRSRSRSSSASPPRVEDVGYWEMKTRAPTPPSPENEEPEPQPEKIEMRKDVEKVTLDESKLSFVTNPVIEKMKEKISFELDQDEVVLSKTQETLQKEESPDASAGSIKREDSPLGMNSDDEEREKREILEKVALIKRKLMETQDEDEKPLKTKKQKKEKAKKKKKKRKKRSSSSSSSSSSDSSLSSSSSTSSSSETSTSSEPKSKRLVDALMAQLSGESEDKSSSHRKSSKKSRKASKRESSKKKKKKDKKRKKEKRRKKEEPESLSTYITSNGLYHCKYCNFTSVVGGSFLEHLISEEHKLLLQLIKSKVNQ